MYFPASGVTQAAVTDSAGGTVSSTIAAADILYVQSTENNERSSLADALNDLQTIFRASVGVRGFGYKPFINIPTDPGFAQGPTGTTISAAGATHTASNENDYRANLVGATQTLLAAMRTAKGSTGPVTAFTDLTDNSGGTPADTISTVSGVYSQSGENNSRASFASKLNAIAAALGA